MSPIEQVYCKYILNSHSYTKFTGSMQNRVIKASMDRTSLCGISHASADFP